MKRTHRQKRGNDLDDPEEEEKLHQVMQSEQLSQRKKYKKVSAELRDRLILMVRGGKSIHQSAKTLGINYENAKYLFRTYGNKKGGHDKSKSILEYAGDSSSSGDNFQVGGKSEASMAEKTLRIDVADMSGLQKF